MRLTIAHKHQIAHEAVADSLGSDRMANQLLLKSIGNSIVDYMLPKLGGILDVTKDLPEGLLPRMDTIKVYIDGQHEEIPLGKDRTISFNLYAGLYELGEGVRGYEELSSAIAERNRLDRAYTRMKADLLNEVLMPATTLSGLLKKWPQAHNYLPQELKSEVKASQVADRILSRQEDE